MKTTTDALYHYTDSGLDWVYLADGFQWHDTPYGRGMSVSDADGLHSLLLRDIMTSPHPIRGQELRFVRSMLDLSQDGIGKIMGVKRLAVTRMEGHRSKPISPSADRALRLYLALKEWDRDLAARIEELLNEMDDREHDRAEYAATDHGWARAA